MTPNPAMMNVPLQPAPAPQWQTLPAKVRGAAPDPAPAPRKFVMPSPEALGVATRVTPTQPTAPKTPVDWNQIQTRMERLNVLRYEKDRSQSGIVRVTLLLPTSDPTRGQPVVAQAETEAAAIMLALQAGETWMRNR